MAKNPFPTDMVNSGLGTRKPKLIFRPGQLVVFIAVSIFMAEATVMIVLGDMPQFNRWLEALIDASFLLLLLLPLYYYFYRPFWEDRLQYQYQIQYLSHQLLSATEEERKRITHELHDQCGQTMTALQFGLQALKKRLPEANPQVEEQIDHLVTVTAQLATEFREMTARLRPVALDELGLFAALRGQLEDFRNNYPDIKLTSRLFRESALDRRLEPSVEDALFRISQEALTNIVRHAGASKVTVRFWQENNTICLSIQDNGCGFDLQSCWKHPLGICGIGLLGMRERATNLGGSFHIVTEPGKGTTIQVCFPLNKERKT